MLVAKYAQPVVVALPLIVRPFVPLPIVEEALEITPFVILRSEEKILLPEKVLLSERSDEEALLLGRQVPLMAKQPWVMFRPFP